MAEDFTFDLIRNGRPAGQVSFSCAREGNDAVIEVQSGSFEGQVFGGESYFHAFARLRERLGEASLIPACKGALLYVHPSGMSSQMSFGRMAYFIKAGQGRVWTVCRDGDAVSLVGCLASAGYLRGKSKRVRLAMLVGEELLAGGTGGEGP